MNPLGASKAQLIVINCRELFTKFANSRRIAGLVAPVLKHFQELSCGLPIAVRQDAVM